MADTVEFDELDEWYEKLQTAFNEGGDYKAILGLMQNDLEDVHGQWFSQAKSPAGRKWPALKPATVKRKGHDTILVDTGKLKASLEGRSGDSIREIVSEGMNHGLSFGTSVEYSIYHQEGGQHLPQREHVGINDEILDDFAERVAERTIAILLGGE